MYDWSGAGSGRNLLDAGFSCCWKDVRLKLDGIKTLWSGLFKFQLLLKGCTIEASITSFDTPPYCFSCCWKDVRLKQNAWDRHGTSAMFQLLLKGCTIEASKRFPTLRKNVSVVVERMYDWSQIQNNGPVSICPVSVVVERMYDWSPWRPQDHERLAVFQLLLKGCTIEALMSARAKVLTAVSVVVERMYDWSAIPLTLSHEAYSFSCCWKDVRLKLDELPPDAGNYPSFSCCWKDVRLKLKTREYNDYSVLFQLLLKGCTIEAFSDVTTNSFTVCFSCCWKDVRLKRL